MNVPQVFTHQTFDTELSADSVEWCPIKDFKNYLAVGTYQVDKSDEDQFSGSQRRGRIYLQKFVACESNDPAKVVGSNDPPEVQSNPIGCLEVVQTLDTGAVLDMKWCLQPKPSTDTELAPVLATADAKGDITIYTLVREENKENLILKEVSKMTLPGEEEKLALSLDWDTNKTDQLLVSDSKGYLTVLVLTSALCLEVLLTWHGHDYEAWIGTFNSWSKKLQVFSGGDDCKLKCFDIDVSGMSACQIFASKRHDMGVTSLLSDVRNEFRLFSGSYDEKLYFWDTRSMKCPTENFSIGGGVWRLRQMHRCTGDEKSECCDHLLAVAGMHNGFHLVDTKKCQIVASYTEEHKSLAYGVDLECGRCLFPDIESEESNCWITSCSFYDHTLKLWSVIM